MSRLLAALVILVVCLSTLGVWPAAAQTTNAEGLFLFTAYPTQEVRAGESVSVSLELKVVNLPPQIVQLEVRNVPEGWRATFQGGGRVVHSVYVDANANSKVTLNVEVPSGVTDGRYPVTVIARGHTLSGGAAAGGAQGGVQAQLPLELIVGKSRPPQLSVEVELPRLKGTPSSNFSYRLRIKNVSDQDTVVNLEFEAPEQFEVTYKKAGSQELAGIPIKAGQTENVDVTVRPSSETPAGEYTVRVRAQSDQQATAEMDLIAVVSGKPDLTLATSDGRLSGRASAGQETPLELILKNQGTAPVSDVRLEASPPAQWDVVFEPQVIENLEPNQEVQVIARIKPPQQAIAGDYVVTLRAVPELGDRKTTEFRVTVTTSTMWGVVGLVLIAVALGVVALAVARFGRR